MLHQVITPAIPDTSVVSMRTKEEREQLLGDIKAALLPFQVETEITPYSDRHFVAMFTAPTLRASVDFDALDPDPSMIHWHNAHAPLAAVPGLSKSVRFPKRRSPPLPWVV